MAAQREVDDLFSEADAADDAASGSVLCTAAPSPVHAETQLATDFLNQYNEITMTLEMLPGMPELFDDVADWQPKSYAEHFRASNFHDRDQIIAAYDEAPARYRNALDLCATDLNAVLTTGLAELTQLIADGQADALADATVAILAEAGVLVSRLNGIINGNDQTSDQAEIDALLAEDDAADQAAIDALFD